MSRPALPARVTVAWVLYDDGWRAFAVGERLSAFQAIPSGKQCVAVDYYMVPDDPQGEAMRRRPPPTVPEAAGDPMATKDPTMTSIDLDEMRLEKRFWTGGPSAARLFAYAIEEIHQLREALRPFVENGTLKDARDSDFAEAVVRVNAGHYRRACAALGIEPEAIE